MKLTSLLTLILLSLTPVKSALAAASWWSANAATATPHVQVDGSVRSKTFDLGAHGRGVRHLDGLNGTIYLYLPVTANNAETFSKVGLRAEDNTVNGFVRAEFIRQSRNANAAPAVVLGSVTTANIPGDGFQFVSSPFAPVTLDLSQFTYYIRISLSKNVAAEPNVTAYDVSLEP